MTTAAESTGAVGVSNQLASLVPSFDPSKDDMVQYQQRVELVTAAWPKTKITELVTRLILNCQGSAFAKLQLHQSELLTGEESSVKRLIEILGGQWGRIPLEKQYQEAEEAIFHTIQRADESNDSFLARSDVMSHVEQTSGSKTDVGKPAGLHHPAGFLLVGRGQKACGDGK